MVGGPGLLLSYKRIDVSRYLDTGSAPHHTTPHHRNRTPGIMSGKPKGNRDRKVCHNCRNFGHIVTNRSQGGHQNMTRLPDRTAPNQAQPTPPTSDELTGPIWVPDASTSDKGPKVYTEADFISFDIQRTEEQKRFSTVDLTFEHGLRISHGKKNHFPQERRIITNYVKINKKPKWVYVYKLSFVRERETSKADKVVNDRTERGAIFEALKTRPGYVNLNNREDYATD